MMRRIVLVIAVVFAVNVTWGQDTKAKKILDQVSEKARSYESVSADFTFSQENKEMDIEESNYGSIKIKGEKYHLKMKGLNGSKQESEYIIEMISDGTTLWNYMKDGNQVLVSDIDEEGNELTDPSKIFIIYEKGFESKFIEEKVVQGKSIYRIDLFPDSDEFEVSKIEISIDKATMMIHNATLFSTDGNLYIILVKKMDTGKNFPDSEFKFDSTKYEDLEVIDVR